MSEKYCDIQENCKELQTAITQYNKVVEQNQNLQSEIHWYKSEADKDEKYLIKLEEANMSLDNENEKLKRALEAITEFTIFNITYGKDTLRENLKSISDIAEEALKCEEIKMSEAIKEQLQSQYLIMKSEIDELKKENQKLKNNWNNSTKCHHLVLDECSLNGKKCKGLQKCFKDAEEKIEKIKDECSKNLNVVCPDCTIFVTKGTCKECLAEQLELIIEGV